MALVSLDVKVCRKKRDTALSALEDPSATVLGVACIDSASAWLICWNDLFDSDRVRPPAADTVTMAGGAREPRLACSSSGSGWGAVSASLDSYRSTGIERLLAFKPSAAGDGDRVRCVEGPGTLVLALSPLGVATLAGVDALELLRVSSGDWVVESSHSPSSSSSED
jgi:hypothetical protein